MNKKEQYICLTQSKRSLNGFEVYKLNRRYSERKYGPFMPGRGQFNCLLVLDERGTLNQKDLAAYLAIRSTSAGSS